MKIHIRLITDCNLIYLLVVDATTGIIDAYSWGNVTGVWKKLSINAIMHVNYLEDIFDFFPPIASFNISMKDDFGLSLKNMESL